MTSDHTIDTRTTTTDTPSAPPAATRSSSALLWVLLVLGVFANVTASAVLHDVYVSSASGLLVLGCVAALAVRAHRNRTGA
jgi:hypothetical protein